MIAAKCRIADHFTATDRESKPMRIWKRLAATAGLVCALGAVGAPAAQATPDLEVELRHGPTNIAPGGAGQYAATIRNLGTSPALPENATFNGPEPLAVVVELPDGVTATSASGSFWACTKTGGGAVAGSSSVTCTQARPIFNFGATMAILQNPGSASPKTGGAVPGGNRGVAPVVFVNVQAAPDATLGSRNASVQVSGGGPTAANGGTIAAPTGIACPCTSDSATDTDPTTFSETSAGFGVTPGSFEADAFDGWRHDAQPVRQAGAHPYEARFDLDFNLKLTPGFFGGNGFTEPDGHLRTQEVKLPDGLIGNPEATPQCPRSLMFLGSGTNQGSCPPNTQVGTIDLQLNNADTINASNWPNEGQKYGVWNLVPPKGTIAAFGFAILGRPVFIVASLDPSDDYAVKTTISRSIEVLPIRQARLAMWGIPADPDHDRFRLDPSNGQYGAKSLEEPKPFLTLPSQCDRPGQANLRADSWEDAGDFKTAESDPMTMEGCESQRFDAFLRAKPTTTQADSPSGLIVDLSVRQDESIAGPGTPPLKNARVALPEGMSVNPASADGLGACSPSEIGLKTDNPVRCPDSSKVGSVELETPLLPKPVKGSVYLAQQNANPFNSLLALYVVVEDKERGLLVKLPGKIEPDPNTGRLVASFQDNPQVPFSNLHMELKQGPRAPLRTPDVCGTHTTEATLTSWNSQLPVVNSTDSFQISQGCSASKAARPFNVAMNAGTELPIAGAFSPFAMKLDRSDGSQELKGLSVTLPPGLLGKLAGTTSCPEAALATAPGKSAAAELAAPSCPASSLVGKVTVGAGAGPTPMHVTGSSYLAGPYKGAPLSLAIITPAKAGPFDLGTVVVRATLSVNPATAQIAVQSDSVPHILQGIPLAVRSVSVAMDKPQFTFNPTSCAPMAIDASASSIGGAIAPLASRFQVGACAALGFKPHLKLNLIGGTKRGAHPKLRAVLTARPGEANIGRAQVSLPKAVFLDQGSIGTVCTRVQFAAKACPAASVYGKATAFTPILDQPLTGPVYMRSSSNNLPDLVAALKGPDDKPVEVELSGRIDSVKGGGIRTTFAAVPDAPVTRFVLEMKGGAKKGLVELSRDVCRHSYRADVKLDAQSGKVHDFRPPMRNGKCGKGRKKGAGKSAR